MSKMFFNDDKSLVFDDSNSSHFSFQMILNAMSFDFLLLLCIMKLVGFSDYMEVNRMQKRTVRLSRIQAWRMKIGLRLINIGVMITGKDNRNLLESTVNQFKNK